MKTIAICNNNFIKLQPKNKYFDFLLCGENMSIGILDNFEETNCSKLRDDSVLIKVKAFSCNYRDKSILLYSNDLCHEHERDQKVFLTYFGSEFVAEVIDVGENVKNLKIGDRVIPDGSFPFKSNGGPGGIPTNHASRRMHCLRENQLVKIPDSMPDEVAASFTIASQTVYGMIRRLNLTKESTVLVTAATSNTSLAVIKALINKGIKTYAISSNEHFEKQLLDLSIHRLIPYSALTQNTVKDYLKDTEFDAVIDPFFDIYSKHLIDHMKFGGKYIFCGIYNQSSYFNPLEQSHDNYLRVMSQCIRKNISIIGNCLGSESDLQNALDDYAEGRHDIVIDSVYTGDDVVPFLQKTFHAVPRFGKVVYKY